MPELTCICCGKNLEPIMDSDDCYQPFDGLMCYSEGNYGSIFDPIDEVRKITIFFIVCDECLVKKIAHIYESYSSKFRPCTYLKSVNTE